MSTNRDLRKDLLKKLGVTQQALSLRVQRKKRQMPMSTEDATYLIAHEVGIRIDRYLNKETLHHVRELASQIRVVSDTHETMATRRSKQQRDGRAAISEHVVRFPNQFKTSNPLLSQTKLNEARDMAAVYPLLYVLENSMREVVRRIMGSKYGDDWWEKQLTKGKAKNVKQKADARRAEESRNKWHQRRGAHPIDYVDMEDLETIVRSKESDFFPDILPDKEWFGQFMRELYASRCVICHMNPLDKTNILDLKIKIERWNRVIRESRSKIP